MAQINMRKNNSEQEAYKTPQSIFPKGAEIKSPKNFYRWRFSPNTVFKITPNRREFKPNKKRSILK